MTNHTYEATARREGTWWLIAVPELDAVTQARRVGEIDEMATGLVQALLDLEDGEAQVNVTIELPETVAESWRLAGELRAQAEADGARAAALSREAVTALVAQEKLTQVEAATLLGISPQRVQQLVSAGAAKRPHSAA